jgi:hypothetical protein
MKIYNGTTVEAGAATPIGSKYRSDPRAVQVQLVGTSGSVRLQGRAASDAPWVDLGVAFTASTVQFIQLMAEVRANVTAISAAEIDVWVDAEKS